MPGQSARVGRARGATKGPGRHPFRCSTDTGGQATVEFALLLPVLVLALLLVVQVGLIARDRVLVVHAARTAARAVVVSPDATAANRALTEAVGRSRYAVSLGGDARPGGLAEVTVSTRATMLPLIGRIVPAPVLRERLVVRVEEPP